MLSADESVGAGQPEATSVIDKAGHEIHQDGFALPFHERRRPGRPNYATTTLMPLLRGASAAELELEAESEHGLAAATGIAVSMLFSCLIWAMLGLAY